MQRRAAKELWDAAEAAGQTLEFVKGRTFEEYEQDRLLQSAVERGLCLVGASLGRFEQSAPDDAARVPDLAVMVARGKDLVTNYFDVDNSAVWTIVDERLGPLHDALQCLLPEVGA